MERPHKLSTHDEMIRKMRENHIIISSEEKLGNYISTVTVLSLFLILIIPVLMTIISLVMFILNLLPDTFSLFEFYKTYFYSGEILPNMNAWRVHIIIVLLSCVFSMESYK